VNDTAARPWHPLAPHQPRPARDAAYALEPGGVESGQGRRSSDDATLAGVTLFDALYAFLQEHHRCGDLAADIEGDRV
jgi:hypothetical protein